MINIVCINYFKQINQLIPLSQQRHPNISQGETIICPNCILGARNAFYVIQLLEQEIMYCQVINDRHLSQSQLYQDLSTLILTFKKCISLAEAITSMVQKMQDQSSAIIKIKQTLQQLDPLKQKYNKTMGHEQIEQITFHRFTCRLLQMIGLSIKKYNHCAQFHPYKVLMLCLREIQSIIKKCQEERQIYRLIKITEISFVKFCINCKNTDKCGGDESDRKCEETFKEMKQKIIKHRTNQQNKGKDKRNIEGCYQYNQLSSDQSDTRSQRPNPGMNTNYSNRLLIRPPQSKELICIQKRFETLKDLDLDFVPFKASYYLAKGNAEQFYREYMDRNMANRRIITCYSDDFYLFQKKKSQKQGRRDRVRQYFHTKDISDKTANYTLSNNGSSQYVSLNHNINRIFQQNQIKSNLDLQIYGKNARSKEDLGSKSVDIQNNKQQLKMKNVQITLWKKNKETKNIKANNASIFKNKTKLQPMCINQSYYNDLESQANQSLQFIHSKLKIQTDVNKRNKTQVQKNEKKQKNKKQQKNFSEIYDDKSSIAQPPLSLSIKSRSTFKGKYLQVNCLSQKQDYERRKIIITKQGSTITKINLRNAYRLQNNRKLIVKLKQC